MTAKWPRDPGEPIVQMLLPRLYGSIPTLFGAPLAETREALKGHDVAFLGIPWRAPTPDSRLGPSAANYAGTLLTPGDFRMNSIKYGGYLPELDIDVFERLKFVDYGDIEVARDLQLTFSRVGTAVTDMLEANCIPFTMGGNAGPSTYPVLQAIAARAQGPTAVLNFDAHHDNRRGEWHEDDPKMPRWASSWARRILTLPGVDPTRYFHVGLRGPRNDRGTFERWLERGVKRENITTYRELKAARKRGFDEWAAELAVRVTEGARKVWLALDPDVLNLGASPDFGDEPLGPTTEEVVEIAYQVGRAAGREKFGGISFMATPNTAQTLHFTLIYVALYALAGVVSKEVG